MKKVLTSIALLFIVNVQIFAVTAYPHPIVFAQPNGEEVTVKIKGDERIHWHESIDGYTLLYNQDGYLTYAVLDEDGNLQPSDFIVTDIEKRDVTIQSLLDTVGKKLFYSDVQIQLVLKIWEIEDDFETKEISRLEGQYKTLCAFVQFPEKSMIKTINQFEGLMNQLGYTGNGTGSVRDFFKESSYNKFDLIVTLCGIYTAPQSQAYYAGNSGTQNCQQLARWAALQIAENPDINFADYDSNNDGKVDGFHFIFAGMGQEAGGGYGTIWSHKWEFSPPVTKNGKSISIYSCSPELLWGNNITTIGIICHEMTHAFGAPDFYDTNYEQGGQYTGTGNWDVMAEGSWNENGNRPPHHNMYTKVQFGWVTPTLLTTPISISNMPNSADNPVAYRINTGNGNEHYLLDNRQKIKFDQSVPGSGLLIYHVHGSVGTNCINCTHPQRMYPVCASSTVAIPVAGSSNYGNINSAGCPFPGTSNKTSFNGTSTPRMFYWTNNTVIHDKALTNITHSGGLISFLYRGGNNAPQYTVALSAEPTNAGSVTGAGTYYENDLVTAKATPNTGFAFLNWTKSGTVVSTNATYEFNIAENTTLVANFKSNNANLSNLTVSQGVLTPTFSPNTTNYTVNVDYSVTTIDVTGTAADPLATVTGNVTNAPLSAGENNFTVKVTAQSNVTKNYYVKVIRGSSPQFTIVSSVENNIGGTISPEGSIPVDEGSDITFTMTPESNYTIEKVLVDGENVEVANTYTFQNVVANHSIIVKFTLQTSIEQVETQQITVYPNPTGGEFVVTSNRLQVTDIEIFDLMGRKVYEQKAEDAKARKCESTKDNSPSLEGWQSQADGVVINISHLPAGMYFLRIQTEADVITRKIIKN